MKQLARFFEELPLGVVHNPHTNRRETLTELVTVCPSCHSMRSLRHDGEMVQCEQCYWTTPDIEPAEVA